MREGQTVDVEKATFRDLPLLGRVVTDAYVTEEWQEGHLGPIVARPFGMLAVLVSLACGKGFTNTPHTAFLAYTSDLKTALVGLVLVAVCSPLIALFASLQHMNVGLFVSIAIDLLLGLLVLGAACMILSLVVFARGIYLKRLVNEEKRPDNWAADLKVHRCWRVKWRVGSLAASDSSGFALVAALNPSDQPRHICLRVTAADDRLCYLYVKRYRFAHHNPKHYRQLYRHAE